MNKTRVNLIKSDTRYGYFAKRVFAFAVDWYISSVILNLIIRLLLIFTGFGSKDGSIISYNLPSNLILIGSSLLVAFIYYVYIPYKSKKTATIMMKVMGLEIVSLNDSKPSLNSLLNRFFIGSFFLQGILYSSFNTIIQTLSEVLSNKYLSIIDFLISVPMLILVIYSSIKAIKDRRLNQTIQGKISNTYVIERI
ncbi:MAG: RDD family protein [Anaerococcus sp.]|nr:RDD family protein [Anaerococcus sp.]